MNTVEVWIDDDSLGQATKVGVLARTTSRTGNTISFEYDPDWIDHRCTPWAFEIDHECRLVAGPVYARAGADALTAAFQDCAPDRWGILLMDRREAIEARAAGRQRRQLQSWDYLLGVHDTSRMGALRLRMPGTDRHLDDRYLDNHDLGAPPVTRLRELEGIAARVERGDFVDAPEAERWIRMLSAPGASLGGARPKANYSDPNGELWLAKFPGAEDAFDVGLFEFIAREMSVAARIDMPAAQPHRFSDRGHTFTVRRFDRTKQGRRAYASAMNLLDRTDSTGASYLDLAETIERHGDPAHIDADLEQLFRRAVFNVLIGNRDDHLRNHGFLRAHGGWRLAPAFDVNPNVHSAQHVLAIDEADPTPDTQLALNTADYYRLSTTHAERIVSEIRSVVRDWEPRARALHAKADEIDLMRGAIDPNR